MTLVPIIKGFLISSFVFCQIYAVGQESFRQRVDHYLQVELDDARQVLTGTDSVLYHNNSPEPLSELFFHIRPNACIQGSVLYQQKLLEGKNVSAFSKEVKDAPVTGIFIRVNGKPVRWKTLTEHPEFIRVELNMPLPSMSCDTITIMFRSAIPEHECAGLSRSGSAYLLSNWFPRPVVYNQFGWQIEPLQISGSGGSEFGSLEASITLPRNYVVVSSGKLMNAPEEQKWLEDMDEKTRRINRWGRRTSAGFPASSPKYKTLKFQSEYADDMVFCLDKRFHHLRDTLSLPGISNPVDIEVFFTPIESHLWSGSLPMVKKFLANFYEETGFLPFDKFTLVQAAWLDHHGAAPGLVYLGSVMAPLTMEYQLCFQMNQYFFSSIVPFNSLKYPWIVHGLASYYTSQYIGKQYNDTISMHDILLDPGAKGNMAGLNHIPISHMFQLLLQWHLPEAFVPLDLPASHYSSDEIYAITGLKSGLAWQSLFGSIGEQPSREMMHQFIHEWKYKFPRPSDLQNFLKQGTGGASDWFFEMALKDPGFADYRINGVKENPHGYTLEIENRSNWPVPYTVTSVSKTGEQMLWIEGHTGKKFIEINDTTHSVKRWVIDKKFMLPEIRKQNNTIRSKGILKKVEPFRFFPVLAAPNPGYTILMGSPVVGWNGLNGFMAGVALYSNPVIPPATEFLLMPLYGFGSRSLNGTTSLRHLFRLHSGNFSHMAVGLQVKMYGWADDPIFSYYQRWMPFVDLNRRKPDSRKKYINRLSARSVIISDNRPWWNSENGEFVAGEWTRRIINELSWRYHSGKALNSFNSSIRIQQTGRMARLLAEGNWFVNYKNKVDKGIDIRGFSGIFLTPYDDDSPVGFNITSAGVLMNTKTKYLPADPMLDYLYLNRTDPQGLLRQHFYRVDGGFHRATTVGNTTRWMVTTNITSTLPGRLPFQLYLDAGIFADDASSAYFKSLFLYSAGVKFTLLKNVAEIYFPLPFFESAGIREREELNNPVGYFKKIRFVLNLPLLNPLGLSKRISF